MKPRILKKELILLANPGNEIAPSRWLIGIGCGSDLWVAHTAVIDRHPFKV